MHKIILTNIFIFIFIATNGISGDCVKAQEPRDLMQDSLNVGWVEVVSNYPIQRIWIDSVEIAVIGEPLFELTGGKHLILAMPKIFDSWMLRTFKSEIEITIGDTLNLPVSFPEFKMIHSNPFGANVLLDGIVRGETPCLLPIDELNTKPITLQKIGYRDTTFYAVNEQSASMIVQLESNQTIMKKQQSFVKTKLDKKKRDRKYALLTFGLSIASGTTALLLKQKADQNYDRYKKAGSPDDIRHFLNQTEKFDRLSAGAYVVFEINLVASTYFLFRSILRE